MVSPGLASSPAAALAGVTGDEPNAIPAHVHAPSGGRGGGMGPSARATDMSLVTVTHAQSRKGVGLAP